MKKVLSLVLTLSLVLGTFSMAFAASFSDVAGEDFEDAVTVLTELGVVSGYDDGTYKPENIVTRAEMAVLVVRALGYDNLTAGTSSFTDMNGYGWAQPYISYAQSLGVISGYGDGTFRPGKTVSYDEAATMLVAALGYTTESLQGTWPANFVDKAKVLGILDDVQSGSAGANRGDIATMVYQTLDQAIGKVNKDGDWVNQNAEAGKANDTMLARLGASQYNKGNAFVVTYEIAQAADTNLMPYIGAYVTAYENKDGDVMAINEVKSTFLTGKATAADKFKADGVEYTITDKAFLGTTTDAAVKFDNAKAGANVDNAIIWDNAGKTDKGEFTLAVDLSGKTIKQVYSVMEWTPTQYDFFSKDDAADIKDDHSLFGSSLPEDDNNNIDTTMFALMGATSLDKIATDDVVYVYELGGKGDIIRVEVGTEEVKGKISRISGDDYTIAGTVYSKASKMDSGSINPKAGDEVKAYLDYSKNIYKFEKISGGASDYAFVIDMANGEAGLNGSEPKIKMILANGNVTTFEADEEEIADSILVESTKAWTAAVTKGSIVKYSVDKNGVLDDIATTAAIDKHTAQLKISDKGYYDGKKIDTNATIFTFSGTTFGTFTTASDDYGVTTLEKVKDTDKVNSYYVLDDGVIVAMIIDGDATSADDVYGVVTDRAENDSDAGYEIEMLIDGKTVTNNAKQSAYNTAGTKNVLYQVTYDTAGNVKLDAVSTATTTGNVDYAASATTGASISGSVVNFKTPATLSGAKVTGSPTTSSITLDSSVVVYKWNTVDKAYEKGTTRDIEKATATVKFYDAGDDQVYDIVLVD